MNVILGIMGNKGKKLPSEILSQFNFIIASIFTLESKSNDLYSDCVNAFCLYRTCVNRRKHMWMWRSLKLTSIDAPCPWKLRRYFPSFPFQSSIHIVQCGTREFVWSCYKLLGHLRFLWWMGVLRRMFASWTVFFGVCVLVRSGSL